MAQTPSIVHQPSPLNRTLIVGSLFAAAADCLSTLAQFLDDIGKAHALHYQQQQERAFEQAARLEISAMTDRVGD